MTLNNLLVTIQPNPAAAPVSLTLPSFTLRVEAVNPLLLHLDWPSQMNVNTSRANVAITFGSISQTETIDLRAVLAHDIYPFTAFDYEASNINFLASSGSLLMLHIDGFTGHGTLNRTAGADATMYSYTDTIDGIAISPLLTRLASVPFGGKITRLGLTMNVSGPAAANWQALMTQINAVPETDRADRDKILLQAIHDWAAQGGSANAKVNLAVGPSTLNADGSVKFDANVQPQGTANLTADHLDAFSAAVVNAYPQLQSAVNGMEARLSPYLSSTDAGGQTLTLHVTYGHGNVAINGQAATALPPLDWTLLENPPPPPAQAPGDGSGAAAP